MSLFVILGGGGCRATLTAGLDVGSDGHGTVRAAIGLDDEAVRTFGDLRAELRVDDLRQAGWEVEGPEKEDDGLTWVRASRPFSDAEGANQALAQLSGPGGPLRDLRLTRSRSLLRTRTQLSGVVDLSGGIAGFSDPELAAKVGDTLPLDLDRLRRELGPDADQELQVSFSTRLPGSIRSNASAQEDGRAVWQPALGQQLRIEASAEGLALVPLVPAVAVLLLLMVTGAFLIVRRRRA